MLIVAEVGLTKITLRLSGLIQARFSPSIRLLTPFLRVQAAIELVVVFLPHRVRFCAVRGYRIGVLTNRYGRKQLLNW